MEQEHSSRKAQFDLVEDIDECVAPCDRMGNFDVGAGKEV